MTDEHQNVVETALGTALAGARAPLGTPDSDMLAAIVDLLPQANLELIRDNEGRDGVRILIWRYTIDDQILLW